MNTGINIIKPGGHANWYLIPYTSHASQIN